MRPEWGIDLVDWRLYWGPPETTYFAWLPVDIKKYIVRGWNYIACIMIGCEIEPDDKVCVHCGRIAQCSNDSL